MVLAATAGRAEVVSSGSSISDPPAARAKALLAKMTLDEKKLSRASRLHSTGGSLLGIMATGLLFCGVAGGIVTAMTPKKSTGR